MEHTKSPPRATTKVLETLLMLAGSMNSILMTGVLSTWFFTFVVIKHTKFCNTVDCEKTNTKFEFEFEKSFDFLWKPESQSHSCPVLQIAFDLDAVLQRSIGKVSFQVPREAALSLLPASVTQIFKKYDATGSNNNTTCSRNSKSLNAAVTPKGTRKSKKGG